MSSKAQTREKDYERGLRIADRRKAMGLSQDELAHRVGIGRQALSAIENGGDFKTRTLDNLAIVLGVSVDLFNSHPRFPFCKRVSHFESDLQILYPTFHFCNDFPVFSLAFMI